MVYTLMYTMAWHIGLLTGMCSQTEEEYMPAVYYHFSTVPELESTLCTDWQAVSCVTPFCVVAAAEQLFVLLCTEALFEFLFPVLQWLAKYFAWHCFSLSDSQ